MIEENILQLGALAVIFFFSMREFFSYLKSRNDIKNNGGNGKSTGFDRQILQELQTMNSNHLHSIEEAINAGNKDIVRTISDGNFKMIEILGEIKGNLRR